ncbi:RecA/RadA recombinase [Gulosibacter sp. 10]|nr:RecA/RadA recombinase [Gulosibacter sp. 10]
MTDSQPTPTDGRPADAADRYAFEPQDLDAQLRDIAEVPAVELITTVAVHLMSAAAVNLGLAEEGEDTLDLDEARKLISSLAGLITASLPYLGDHHARPLRDGLRSLQLAFREASSVPDPVGKGPGEDYTGPVF